MPHKVTVEGKTYGVSFDHQQWEDHPEYNGVTICKIFDYSGPKSDSPPPIILETEAFCSKKDQFNKHLGRKVSLGRAVQRLFPVDGSNSNSESGNYYYDSRHDFWQRCFELGFVRYN